MKTEELKQGQTVYVKGIITDIEEDEILDLEIHTSENNFCVNSSDVYVSIDKPKPVVPQFVAEWIEYCKYNSLTLLGAFEPVSEHGIGLANTFTGEVRKGIDWAKRNQDIFARAWIAYPNITVEKEKLYTVEIPNPNEGQLSFVLMRKPGGNISINVVHSSNLDLLKTDNDLQLTEKEIKKDFDWAWQWKKEVTE
ncbi:DUF1642 domain-containing protein [Streptococcus uberis]